MKYLCLTLIVLSFNPSAFASKASNACQKAAKAYNSLNCEKRSLQPPPFGGYSLGFQSCDKKPELAISLLVWAMPNPRGFEQCNHSQDLGAKFQQDIVNSIHQKLSNRYDVFEVEYHLKSDKTSSELTMISYKKEKLVCKGEGFDHRAKEKKAIRYTSCELNGKKIDVLRDDQFALVFNAKLTVEKALKVPPPSSKPGSQSLQSTPAEATIPPPSAVQ